ASSSPPTLASSRAVSARVSASRLSASSTSAAPNASRAPTASAAPRSSSLRNSSTSFSAVWWETRSASRSDERSASSDTAVSRSAASASSSPCAWLSCARRRATSELSDALVASSALLEDSSARRWAMSCSSRPPSPRTASRSSACICSSRSWLCARASSSARSSLTSRRSRVSSATRRPSSSRSAATVGSLMADAPRHPGLQRPQLDEPGRSGLREQSAGLGERRQLCVVDRVRRRALDDARRALEQLQRDRPRHLCVGGVHVGVEVLAQRLPPQARVDEVRPFLVEPGFELVLVNRRNEPLELGVRRQQDRGRRHLVDVADLQPDDPVLDVIDDPDAVTGGDRRRLLEQ